MSEDKDLERLQAKRLEEMRKNLSFQRKQGKIAASGKKKKATNHLHVRLS